MYADHSLAHIAGQLIVAVYFIWMGVKNILLWDFNVARLAAQGLPGTASLVGGLAIQFTGAGLVLADWNTSVGVVLLLIFTFAATALFHRYWEMENPQRTYHFLLLSNNFCVIGGLLLLL